MKINKRSRIEIIIQAIALIAMFLLVLFNKTIPSVLVWVFSAGTITGLVGSLMGLEKKMIRKN